MSVRGFLCDQSSTADPHRLIGRCHGSEGRIHLPERPLTTLCQGLGPPSAVSLGSFSRCTTILRTKGDLWQNNTCLGFIEVINKLPSGRIHFIAKRSAQFPKVTIQDNWGEDCLRVAREVGRGSSQPWSHSSSFLALKAARLRLYLGPLDKKPATQAGVAKHQAG